MSSVKKGARFFIELLFVTFCLFIILIAVGQVERFIGLTSEVTSRYSIFVMIANLLIVYLAINESIFRAFPLKFFRKKKLKKSILIGMIGYIVIVLGFVYVMGT